MAVVVELRRLSHDGHDAVGAREVEERVDLLIAQPRDQVAQRALLGELLAEPIAPLPLVGRQRGRVQAVGRQRVDGPRAARERCPGGEAGVAPAGEGEAPVEPALMRDPVDRGAAVGRLVQKGRELPLRGVPTPALLQHHRVAGLGDQAADRFGQRFGERRSFLGRAEVHVGLERQRRELLLGPVRAAAEVRRLAGGRSVIAVVKADAYGHGAVEVARTLIAALSVCAPGWKR